MSERVEVRLFAGARELVGSDSIVVELPIPASVQELKQAIAIQFVPLRSLVEFGRIAVDNEFLKDTDGIPLTHSHCTIALIPPVSGG